MTHEKTAASGPLDSLLAGVAGGVFFGLAAAGLTLRLNPHLRGSPVDLFWLHLDLALLYGVAGALLGAAGAVLAALLPRAGGVVAGSLLLGPPLFLLLVPDVGLGLPWLTDLLAASAARRLLGLLLVVLVLGGLVLLLAAGLRALARRSRTSPRGLATLFWGLGTTVLVVAQLLGGPRHEPPIAAPPTVLPPASEPPPARVVLLCIDGADLDDVIEPMVREGELPSFARLMREGTWGPLATLEPTLSPVVWTTLATGRPASEHGIHQFLYFRLPGMRRVIYEFPLHLGLNFRLLPLLEKAPGLGGLRAPYTSRMRRAEALWQLAGRRYPVGVYGWLMSWPAEHVNGFSIAGGIGWAQLDHAPLSAPGGATGLASTYPPGLPLAPPRAVAPAELEPFFGPGIAVDPADPRRQQVLASLVDPTAHELPRLIEQFNARFAAAGFYPVDAYHHLWNVPHPPGEPVAEAIRAAYRLTDARLGELLAALDPAARLIVVSDHGFDFEANHHTRAPAGVFFARGEGFAPGRRAEGLSVYDLAPLVLHLLAMPVPDDLPAARSGSYLAALDPGFLASHPPERIATYGSAEAPSHENLENPQQEEIKDVLRSLGYVQ